MVCTKAFNPCFQEVVHVHHVEHLACATQDGFEGTPGLVSCIVTDHEHEGDAYEIVRHSGADFVHICWRQTAASSHADSILPNLLNLDLCEVTCHIRHMICTRILDLITKLLGDAPEAHNAIGVGRLRQKERPVRIGFNNGISYVVPLLRLVVCEQATRALCRALNQVTSSCAHAELVILVCFPAKLVHHDAQDQCAIDYPAGNNNVHSLLERGSDRNGTEVCICTSKLLVGHLLTRIHFTSVRLPQRIHTVSQIVTIYSCDFQRNVCLLRYLFERVQAAHWIHASSIHDDLDVFLLQSLDVRAYHVNNRPGKACARIFPPLPR
mmetsp:Transcript_112322/g.194773  ORF Transcript_112322/g.194773 Transcript_112322/m.194773 type:complete len:324 (-) Transcript_112322:223-1194(-)